jgi:hypothetical protein
MRRLTIPPPAQLQLVAVGVPTRRQEVWAGLSETTRRQVVALLARLIAKGVVVDAEAPGSNGEAS